MAVEYLKVFADLEGQQLEFWLPKDSKALEKEQSNTEKEIEDFEREIESLQEQKEQREAEESEEEQIAILGCNKSEAELKLGLMKTKLSELKRVEK